MSVTGIGREPGGGGGGGACYRSCECEKSLSTGGGGELSELPASVNTHNWKGFVAK